MKTFIRFVMCLVVSLPFFTSCYDDSAIWDKFGEIESRLDSLEADLNKQVAAMNSLLNDGSVISKCEKNADGSYTLTLSNGTTFSVLPAGTDFSTLVTYTLVDGVNCWATYDASGELVVLKNGGKPIPVTDDIKVELIDGVYYLIVNGEQYMTGYDDEDVVQVFSSCEPLEDASGNVYAVKFTFGEGMEITVALDGYAGVLFRLSSVNTSIISEYFIDYGATQSFLMDMSGVVDYVMQVPDGWRVKVTEEKLTGETYMHVTAPTTETVELGAAVAEGDLKVVSVVEGGKASISKLYVSTNPFKTYNVTSLRAEVELYTGVQKFVYGIMNEADFSREQVIETANSILASSAESPEGYFVSEKVLSNTLADIFGSGLVVGESYVFWAVPALYREAENDGESAFYAKDAMLETSMVNPMLVSLDVTEVGLLDAHIKATVEGSDNVYAGIYEVTDAVYDEIVYQVNNDVIEPVSVEMDYDGLASSFPTAETSVNLEPGTQYVAWVLPAKDNIEEYSVSDIVYETFTTKSLTDGGTAKVSVGEFTRKSASLSTVLSCEGAAMIYYAFLSKTDGKRYQNAENTTRMSKILESESCGVGRGSSLEASVDGLQPNTDYWIYAVAVGQDGRYGEVVCQTVKTLAVEFNAISLTVSNVLIKDTEATLKVTAANGTPTEYIYWVGFENDFFWISGEHCNKDQRTASEYMAANPENSYIYQAMRKGGEIAADGTVTLTNLSVISDYIFLVLAKDASGNYSQAGYHKFTTLNADFGDVVTADTDTYKTTKKWITDNLTWHKNSFRGGGGSGQGYAYYSFDIKIPTASTPEINKDFTAYIYCFGTASTRTVDVMLEVEEECSRSYSVSKPIIENGEPIDVYKPTWTDDSGREITWGLFDYSVMHLHGVPDRGFVTLFPSSGHTKDYCARWEDAECENMVAFTQWKNNVLSYDYWKAYVIEQGNYVHEGNPGSEHSRSLTDPDEINRAAEAYLALYTKYYEDAEPVIFVNDGNALTMTNPSATGVDENGNVVDKVIVMLVDTEGNYYEPMYISVPNYFE